MLLIFLVYDYASITFIRAMHITLSTQAKESPRMYNMDNVMYMTVCVALPLDFRSKAIGREHTVQPVPYLYSL